MSDSHSHGQGTVTITVLKCHSVNWRHTPVCCDPGIASAGARAAHSGRLTRSHLPGPEPAGPARGGGCRAVHACGQSLWQWRCRAQAGIDGSELRGHSGWVARNPRIARDPGPRVGPGGQGRTGVQVCAPRPPRPRAKCAPSAPEHPRQSGRAGSLSSLATTHPAQLSLITGCAAHPARPGRSSAPQVLQRQGRDCKFRNDWLPLQGPALPGWEGAQVRRGAGRRKVAPLAGARGAAKLEKSRVHFI
jgi:hypothetical protein